MSIALDMSLESQLRELVEAALRKGVETRYSLAKKAGVQYRTLARWLDEDRDIKLSTADKLCDFFEIRLTKPGE